MDNQNERFEKIEKLIGDNCEITQKLLKDINILQKKMKDHIEDQLTIAFNLQVLKEKINDIGNKSISNSETAIGTTKQLVDGLESHYASRDGKESIEFLKSLMSNDFISMQKEEIEKAKQQILATQKNTKKSNGGAIEFFKTFTPAISYITFIITLILIIKFKL